MSQKNYSPLQVRNPSSLQHLAVMRPGQGLDILIDHEMYPGDINVEISSQHLVIKDVMKDNKRNVYHIEHDPFVSVWSGYSKSLLGEVWIDTKERLSKVLVVMDCINPEKEKNFTVINPDCYDVRIKPYNIIEVVLFSEEFSGNDEWNWEWRPTIDVEIEEIGYSSLNLYTWSQFSSYVSDSPSDLYARHPRYEVAKHCNPWMKQHHFWFRFNKTILSALDTNFGVGRVGDLKFVGYSNRYCKYETETNNYNMSVYVDLRSKFKEQVLDTLHLSKQTDHVPQTSSEKSYGPLPQGNASIVHLKKHKKEKRIRQQVLPLKKDVVINRLPFDSLEEGCKVLSCSPEMSQIPEEDCYGYDECDDFYNHQPNGNTLWKRLYRRGLENHRHWD